MDLPTPGQLRGRWAAWAAVNGALGSGRGCWARDGVWHYDDAGGNWVDLHHLGDGRAVLVGHDHECSPEPEEGFDPLVGTPDWWAPPAREAVRSYDFIGFVYGFDGVRWQRAGYAIEDGFRAIGLPALSRERTHHRITGALDREPQAPAAAIDALIDADADLTEDLVAAVTGAVGDPAAGARHGRAFREV
ncbi:proteophosphoglycan 5 [Streptomyces xiamenensis]|uniref:proteophosphoglycan 5 n=1 Tax=Streptomyces xiamenensis TaxID=408015 RepID=UPI0036EB07E3